MAGFLNYFQWPSLPRSEDTGVGEVATKEANSLVERILEESKMNQEEVKSISIHISYLNKGQT